MPNLSASGSLTEDLLLTQKKRYLEAWLIGKSMKGNTFSFLIYNKTMNLYDVNSGYMPTYNSMMIMPTMIMPPLMPKASGLRGRRTATPAATLLSCLRSSVAGQIQ